MPITLVTGTPGAGKTLYSVSVLLRQWLSDTLKHEDGREFRRKLQINGVRDLLLEHEPIDLDTVKDWSKWDYSAWDHLIREPGDPPLEVPHRVENWWLWVQPGDVVVVDECQRLFKAQAAGSKIPMFIQKLETHRHYGVDFLVITQGPALIHKNLRELVGRHLHVRGIAFGRCLIYEYDVCNTNSTFRGALKVRYWKRDKAAFSLYKSSELHTKQRATVPVAAFGVLFGASLAFYFAWDASKRTAERFGSQAASSSAAAASQNAPALPVAVHPGSQYGAKPVEDERFISLVRGRKVAPREVVGCYERPGVECVCLLENGRYVENEGLCLAIMRKDIDLYPRPRSERVEPVAGAASSAGA